MPKKDEKVVKRGIYTPDKHFPYHDQKAINVLIKAIDIIKPDFYVDLGDVGEWESFSHWQWKKKKRPPIEYQLEAITKEIGAVNKNLDYIDEALYKANVSEKYFCVGNHDDWCDRFVEENPYLPEYKFKNCVLRDRGYKIFPLGKYLKIGKLWAYHGHHFGGINHTRNHLLKLGGNIMYGHWHDIQQYSLTHIDGVKSAWSIGCLKDMSDETNLWLGRRKHNWSHSFAVVDFFEGGLFTVHVVQIINGMTSLWGELIRG